MMSSSSRIELADRLSRRRPIALVVLAGYFILIHLFAPAVWGSSWNRGPHWALHAGLVLLALLPIAGIGRGRGVRALVNDEVSRTYLRSATAAGFWLAMIVALALYVLPMSATLAARTTIYLIVTPAVAGALLVLAWLEWRAHRDG